MTSLAYGYICAEMRIIVRQIIEAMQRFMIRNIPNIISSYFDICFIAWLRRRQNDLDHSITFYRCH